MSTPLDLAACARRIAQRDNRFYERRFVRKMRERLCATGRYWAADFAGLRSVEEMDDRITAPSFGFGNAGNYYRTQSAVGFLERIRCRLCWCRRRTIRSCPSGLLVGGVRRNPRIELLVTETAGISASWGAGTSFGWTRR